MNDAEECDPTAAEAGKTDLAKGQNRWPQWRGVQRDGRVDWLPKSLPLVPSLQWIAPLASDGLGGIAADGNLVVLGCRDEQDAADLFSAFDATTGELLWNVLTPAPAKLDYGNSPRATPLIQGELVYLLGATGQLSAVKRESGLVVWQHDLATTYGTPELDWGLVGSSIIVDNLLIVQPGGVRGSIVAFDAKTGKEVWKTGNAPPGHSSLIAARFGSETQVIGYDKTSLCGWNAKTGERLWSMTPPVAGDFNVPTPLFDGGKLIVSTENNGTRIYKFDEQSKLDPKPIAHYEDLVPDSHTPVIIGDRLYGVANGLHCLQLKSNGIEPPLALEWMDESSEFYKYASLVASTDRLLCLTLDCQLLLIDPAAEQRVVDRWRLRDDGVETLSHPAFLGSRIYTRMGRELVCYNLEELP